MATFKRIFVQMVSYRDAETHATIADLFKKAAYPERISVGLCLQVDPEADAALPGEPPAPAKRVRVVQYHVKDAQGAGWARNEAQKLWKGEEYVLQVQAHMRFEPGWDETLIETLEALPGKKNILTAWLPGYRPPDRKQKLDEQLPVATINRLADDAQLVHLIGVMQPQEQFDAPFETAMWVGNFMFTRAQTLTDVPFDPHIYFWGEELNYSARLWTHGYDIYHLHRPVLYHYWDKASPKGEEVYRDHALRRNRQSRMRNLHVLGLEPAEDTAVLAEIEKYGMGTARPLADYFAHIGVDLSLGTVLFHARNGAFGVRAKDYELPGVHKDQRIFVAMASYRDPETNPTIRDMFEKARYPERVFAGICQQLLPEDKDCEIHTDHPEQVRIAKVDAKESKGANWARAKAFGLYRGEEFILQVDSHMRFEAGWDERLLEMQARAKQPQAVISGYLPGYALPDKRDYSPYYLSSMKVKKLGGKDDPQLVHLTGEFMRRGEDQAGLSPTPFVIANFVFAPASVWQEVPVDPHIYFHGDEISLAARLFTHGFNIYQPDSMVLYHHWQQEAPRPGAQPYRNIRLPEAARSRERVQHLLGIKKSDNKEALLELSRYGLGTARSMEQFWDYSGVDVTKGKISDKAKTGRWDKAPKANTRPAAKKARKAAPERPRIFVQVASYRDPDCQHTIKDMYEKATHPERVFTGIVWQFVPEEDAICFEIPYDYPDQVRVHEVNAKEGKGACWARSLTQTLWEGEEYTLQIDSHMRFEQGWDETLLSMLAATKNPQAVLTCYPPGFTPPGKLNGEFFFGMRAKEFDNEGIFKMTAAPAYRRGTPMAAPMRGAFFGACMFFGPSSIIEDVPYDPHLYFFGEEISLAVRFWTHGYDLYHPNDIVMYHDWDRSKRPTHFSDHKDWTALNRISTARVRHMLGTETSYDPKVLAELDTYGLGKARTLAEYQEYSGVDFKHKLTNSKAQTGMFPPHLLVRIGAGDEKAVRKTIEDLFANAAKPERIIVGLTAGRPRKAYARMNQLRFAESDAEVEGLRRGEEFSLLISPGMSFMTGWDEQLIEKMMQGSAPEESFDARRYQHMREILGDPAAIPTTLPKIFVRIASYRDAECQWTIKDLFEKATYPDRVTVGICWQFDEKEDAHCFEVVTRPEQVRIYPVDWRETEGVCWARAQTEFLHEDEEYTLQIDSHMRFAPGWDELMIAELAACPSKKAVLSSSPAKYVPPHNLDKFPRPTIRVEKPFNTTGNLRGTGEFLDQAPEVPLPAAFIAAGYVFSRSEVLSEVPYDPYLYFDQEEIMYALRLYTHGWDIFSPRNQFIYHYYNVGEVSGRPLHWHDLNKTADSDRLKFFSARGLARFNHLTGHKLSHDGRTLIEIERFGLGKVRSLADYEAWSGIDFKYKVTHPRAQRAEYIPDLSRYRRQPLNLRPAPAPPAPPAAPRVQMPFGKSYGEGDILPYFKVQETGGKTRSLDVFAGRPSLLFLLRFDDAAKNEIFFEELKKELQQHRPDCHIFVMFDAPAGRLDDYKKQQNLPFTLWADEGAKIGRALGIASVPCAFLLNDNLQVKKHVKGAAHVPLVREMVSAMKEHIAQRNAQPADTVREAAPVLIVPEVFSREFCQELIGAFEGGATFDGQVGDKGYVPNSKVRRDFIVPDDLRAKIDFKLSKSLFGEIEKIFGFKVTGRENYKIGLYDGGNGGFFSQHRDNFDEALGYRRVAMTLPLSDDYEGGGLSFPEYDRRIYRPQAGSAIAFSCGMAHEALKVTSGKRYILVGFFHGEEEEEYRQFYAASKGRPVEAEAFIPASVDAGELERSRDFYRRWKEQNALAPSAAAKPATQGQGQPLPNAGAPVFAVGKSKHRPVKLFESRAGVVFDDFLPEELYRELHSFCTGTDYEHINTKGKISRAWHVHDGFPMRSQLNAFYHSNSATVPAPKPNHIYPTGTPFDKFIEFMAEFQPQVEQYTGKRDEWHHFSVTSWLYPPGTGLSMHDDGSGVYTGAYAYFLNPMWRAHWGGMLILMDDSANDAIHAHRKTIDQHQYYKQKWLHQSNNDEMLTEHGMGRCIFPKRNRMVFIANEAYHMVTRVNEAAGDNLRLSLAGFFDRTKKQP